ncbi:hypothetical protein EPA93_43290 [Ktedonosporobacter rubrisoli]|uniref:Uncharacterized protein n=1 Tax=Ktedonosporobacter rubrisoli TaxID=2509675 RepID=A0A4V0Z095_KTERU|nr:hypothetical protein [Ktedonosporobacter rubrisoli]QBD82441.1 hypothetical protein EPA93_43290 [Ktedonosporobacter rubrisoli]
MSDPFPTLTNFLGDLLLYLIFIGIILATISAVVSGILFLPIFGAGERRKEIAGIALRATVAGLIVILLALPARNALLHYFSLPKQMPAIPTVPVGTPTPSVPAATPTPTPTQGQ